ncbi:hypothetical protein J5N97_023347 [Dioscorea zingiberensis]|uniref:Uncharacterized protein n=1 Tax=Dioscorea zingiberensis TaxID=325984 RepID=A0A9D5HBS1_9LILI|nr:hypothetical protein J5N97_023347 [Dioscorea zingiberensis]
MKGGTVQINWHDTQPVLSMDFYPHSGILATEGNDHDIKVFDPRSHQQRIPPLVQICAVDRLRLRAS